MRGCGKSRRAIKDSPAPVADRRRRRRTSDATKNPTYLKPGQVQRVQDVLHRAGVLQVAVDQAREVDVFDARHVDAKITASASDLLVGVCVCVFEEVVVIVWSGFSETNDKHTHKRTRTRPLLECAR